MHTPRQAGAWLLATLRSPNTPVKMVTSRSPSPWWTMPQRCLAAAFSLTDHADLGETSAPPKTHNKVKVSRTGVQPWQQGQSLFRGCGDMFVMKSNVGASAHYSVRLYSDADDFTAGPLMRTTEENQWHTTRRRATLLLFSHLSFPAGRRGMCPATLGLLGPIL
jgi:hypothetical protein